MAIHIYPANKFAEDVLSTNPGASDTPFMTLVNLGLNAAIAEGWTLHSVGFDNEGDPVTFIMDDNTQALGQGETTASPF